MRIAVVDRSLCRPDKCQHECMNVCPINRAGENCIWISERTDGKKAAISEELCIDCGLCIKACPFGAIEIVHTPEQLKEKPVHRFGENLFELFRLPFPIKGEVVGMLGPNGTGKTTALKILSGEIKSNLGDYESAGASARELIKIFRGTELQIYLQLLEKGGVKTVVKPQKIEMLSQVEETAENVLRKHDERKIFSDIVKKLQLEKILNRKLSQLSGGELQRIAIAIAALRKADFYFIDEPSNYLDVYQRLNAAKVIRELAKDSAVLVVEHDLATLDFLADRIHVLYGVPGVYGIVSAAYGTRVGVNAFLDGYLKTENMRVRSEALDFTSTKQKGSAKKEIYLQWENLEKTLGNFDLSIGVGSVFKGEVIGIFGANGLGKTTFAKILAGEIKTDAGKITKSVKISYKPQYIKAEGDETVSEMLSSETNIFAEDFKAMILKPLGIEKLLERKVSELSGGELQAVAIALCLGRKADLYLLDEPSAFLDAEKRLAAGRAIRKFCEAHECSALIIDHDLLFLSYLADRAIVFSGISAEKGTAEQMDLQAGFNKFLREVDITFRRDPQTMRPRANKPGSQKDLKQKAEGKYFVVE
ncbi:MAG TPA: ribosome biogenesis/translation initiation ATPase RLI [archaeon]|nr:ribosome biogenesis/translation initiation ATPase RLI [archaeon]